MLLLQIDKRNKYYLLTAVDYSKQHREFARESYNIGIQSLKEETET